MGLLGIVVLSVGLAMDAFAVSVVSGLQMRRPTIQKCIIIGLYFGVFQAGMPLIGYFVGSLFAGHIGLFAPWIAFVLLVFLGIRMIRESRKEEDHYCLGKACNFEVCQKEACPRRIAYEEAEPKLTPMYMLPRAIATSIDALAVGVSFAMIRVNIWMAVSVIGIITCAISMFGVKIGFVFGEKYKAKAELAGGIILCLIGAKILMDHFGILPF